MALTFPALRAANLARNSREGWMVLTDWSLDDWLTPLGGEVGEALNIVKKFNRERDGLVGNRETRAQLLDMLADELADAVTYADLLAARFDVTLDDRSFDSFRHASKAALAYRTGPHTVARTATNLIRLMGTLAGVVMDITDGQRAKVTPAFAIGGVMRELDILALHFDIDLGAAVVTKFNATSEKLGFPQRLEVA